MFAVFNRPISRYSSCTLWCNSSMVVATVRCYTRGVRAVQKTEHLSTVFGSITPVTPLSRGKTIVLSCPPPLTILLAVSRMRRASITIIVDTLPLWRPRRSSTGTWLHLCSAFTVSCRPPADTSGDYAPCASRGRSFLRNCSMIPPAPARSSGRW